VPRAPVSSATSGLRYFSTQDS